MRELLIFKLECVPDIYCPFLGAHGEAFFYGSPCDGYTRNSLVVFTLPHWFQAVRFDLELLPELIPEASEEWKSQLISSINIYRGTNIQRFMGDRGILES